MNNRSHLILVADPNEVSRKLLSFLLESAGYTVKTTADGTGVLRVLEDQEIDLLILELDMPNLGGMQVVQAIRDKEKQDGGHLPIMVCTSEISEEDEAAWNASGIDASMAKPIQKKALISVVHRLLGDAPSEASE